MLSVIKSMSYYFILAFKLPESEKPDMFKIWYAKSVLWIFELTKYNFTQTFRYEAETTRLKILTRGGNGS